MRLKNAFCCHSERSDESAFARFRDRRGRILGLTKQQALEMLESDDLVGLGMAAHQMRLKKNDPRVVTYQIDRNINYTNFCTEYCSFCAFYRPLGAKRRTNNTRCKNSCSL